MQVRPLDLTTKKYVYDGFEPDDWYQPNPLNYEKMDWYFTFAELTKNKFENLYLFLGKESFEKIIQLQNIQPPITEFQIFKGVSGLELYYFLAEIESSDNQALILISFGEFQPARYMAHLEGIWEIEIAKT
jgi:hypothetical protein